VRCNKRIKFEPSPRKQLLKKSHKNLKALKMATTTTTTFIYAKKWKKNTQFYEKRIPKNLRHYFTRPQKTGQQLNFRCNPFNKFWCYNKKEYNTLFSLKGQVKVAQNSFQHLDFDGSL